MKGKTVDLSEYNKPRKCDVCQGMVMIRYPKELEGKRVYVCKECLATYDFDEEENE